MLTRKKQSRKGNISVELAAKSSPFDSSKLWEATTHYPTGVAVVTAAPSNGERVAMVVGTFTSISLEPALVGFFASMESTSYSRLRDCDVFTINVLSHAQEDIARALSRKDVSDKLQDIPCHESPLGAPLIDGAVAWFECRIASSFGIGDHDLVVGALQAMDVPNPVLPLLYFQRSLGQYRSKSFVISGEEALLPAVSAVERARSLLEELAAELQREVVVFTRLGEEVIAIASAGEQPNRKTSLLGRRFPFAPPFGALLLDSEEETKAWIDRARSGSEPARWRDRLSRLRERGASLAMLSEGHRSFDEVVEQFSQGIHTPQQRRHLLALMGELEAEYEPEDTSLETGRDLRLTQVRARICGVDVLLSVHGMSQPIRYDEVHSIIETMRSYIDRMERKVT
ncbi:flavin reductase family protein [Nesterenkonia muleiensis]|uniref:flavin reductase family protein n=1 Tax=Nesterenkonia muleiensis TaxID=2282648 RepID=UPI000E736A38|nr:flavin reductase family protein [Nesterenkonia muleiensis]